MDIPSFIFGIGWGLFVAFVLINILEYFYGRDE